jgi:hypothetical protein
MPSPVEELETSHVVTSFGITGDEATKNSAGASFQIRTPDEVVAMSGADIRSRRDRFIRAALVAVGCIFLILIMCVYLRPPLNPTTYTARIHPSPPPPPTLHSSVSSQS